MVQVCTSTPAVIAGTPVVTGGTHSLRDSWYHRAATGVQLRFQGWDVGCASFNFKTKISVKSEMRIQIFLMYLDGCYISYCYILEPEIGMGRSQLAIPNCGVVPGNTLDMY